VGYKAQKVQLILLPGPSVPVPKISRNRNFCFTWNNYDESSKEYLSTLACKYVAFAEELAPTTGTKHLQGYISFANPRTIAQARAKLPGCHVETMLGSILQNEEYCSKAGNLIEFGEKPVLPK